MHLAPVYDQVAALREAFPTARVVADMRFLEIVDARVSGQVAALREALPTARVVACKGLLPCMGAHMHDKVFVPPVTLSTDRADIRRLT